MKIFQCLIQHFAVIIVAAIRRTAASILWWVHHDVCVCVCVGIYFCINMILITLSTFLAVIVINTHIRGDRRNSVPDWLRRVSLSLSLSLSVLGSRCDQSIRTQKRARTKIRPYFIFYGSFYFNHKIWSRGYGRTFLCSGTLIIISTLSFRCTMFNLP